MKTAQDWIRTSTPIIGHKHLKLARLPIPPPGPQCVVSLTKQGQSSTIDPACIESARQKDVRLSVVTERNDDPQGN